VAKPTFKLVITGGQTFSDLKRLTRVCDHRLSEKSKTHSIEIVSGCDNGADKLGEAYAYSRGYAVKRFPADWDGFGKAAGHIRNKQMVMYTDAVIAFWDGRSREARHMIYLARAKQMPLRVIKYDFKVQK
jgi:hypothetical protein